MKPATLRNARRGLLAALSALLTMPAHGQMVEADGLEVGFTTKFELAWNDSGSGGDHDASFWRPIAPAGYSLVGDYAQKGYADPNGKAIVMVLRQTQAGALATPTDFKQIWKDSGSGADRDGSMWDMVCPANYVALGSVAQNGYGKPDVNTYRCVSTKLAPAGTAGNLIWNDSGSGAKADFSAWAIETTAAKAGYANVAANTFMAQASYEKPRNASTLLIPLKQSQKVRELRTPELTDFGKPSEFSEDMVRSEILLPWFAVKDEALSAAQKLAQSPYYTLVREDRYQLLLHTSAEYSDTAQTPVVEYTVGVSETEENNFSEATGISMTVGYTPPGDVGGIHASVTLSKETTSGWSKSATTSQSTTQKYPITVKPGTAGAVYQVSSDYTLFRQNGQQVGSSISGPASSVVFASYSPQ